MLDEHKPIIECRAMCWACNKSGIIANVRNETTVEEIVSDALEKLEAQGCKHEPIVEVM